MAGEVESDDKNMGCIARTIKRIIRRTGFSHSRRTENEKWNGYFHQGIDQ
jgi:hypothetical protein